MVTVTGRLVALLPEPSRAVAVRVWLPRALALVSQTIENGGSRTSGPRAVPSRKNCTPTTETLSVADAETVIALVTDAPSTGAVIATVGGELSPGRPAPLNAATCIPQQP